MSVFFKSLPLNSFSVHIPERQRHGLCQRLLRQQEHNLHHPGEHLGHVPIQRRQRAGPGEQRLHQPDGDLHLRYLGEHNRKEDLCVYHGHEPGHAHFHDPVRIREQHLEGPADEVQRADDLLRQHGQPDDLPGEDPDLEGEGADGGYGHSQLHLRHERAQDRQDRERNDDQLLLQQHGAHGSDQREQQAAVQLRRQGAGPGGELQRDVLLLSAQRAGRHSQDY